MDERRDDSMGRREEDAWAKWDKRLRGVIIFAIGAIVALNEAFIRSDPDIYMLVFSLTLMGIPPVLKADELWRASRRDRYDDDK